MECIIEINLESHILVQNIPDESTNGGPPTQRTILNVDSRSTEITFPFIYLFSYIFILIIFFLTIGGLPRLVGVGGGGGGGGGGADELIALPLPLPVVYTVVFSSKDHFY